MYKKSLAALAVLGVFAGSALAADVTLYGVVDYGLMYQHAEGPGFLLGVVDGENDQQKNDDLTLDSGINAASRIGLMGSEDLGNGYKVSFKLENGFDADDGALGDDGKLFNREARLTVEGPWGELSAGRMGALGSATGTYDTIFAIGDAFDGGDGDLFAAATTDRYDNMLTYRSPKFAGMQATAQYSLKVENDDSDEQWGVGDEGHDTANRYAGIALTGEYGALQVVGAYETLLYSSLLSSDDAQIVSLGANYDFGVAKVFAMGQYFENAFVDLAFGQTDLELPLDGYAAHIGVQIPLAAGTLTSGLYYRDCDDAFDGELSAKNIAGSVKYEYPVSARTTLYGSIGYGQMKLKDNTGEDYDEKVKLTQVYAGITHTF